MGNWDLTTTKEGEITDVDLEHIAEQIKEGFTSGELNDGEDCEKCGFSEEECRCKEPYQHY